MSSLSPSLSPLPPSSPILPLLLSLSLPLPPLPLPPIPVSDKERNKSIDQLQASKRERPLWRATVV